MKEKPELISFKICPFVQRSIITLQEKNIEYSIQYIDLKNKPDWFLQISPLGKVPVLKIDDEALFESSVINEYLDEVYPPSLHPSEPLLKAQNRSWIEFGGGLIVEQFHMLMSKTEEEFKARKKSLKKKLSNLEPQIKGDYFNGDSFSLIDTSYAPFFMRLAIITDKFKEDFIELPSLKNWSDNLLKKDSVIHSVVPEFEELFIQYIKRSGSFLSTKL